MKTKLTLTHHLINLSRFKTLLHFRRLSLVIFTVALLSGCGDAVSRVGPNGADAYPRNTALGSSIRLEAGTRVVPREKVSDNSWEYEVKEGKYEGNYVVILNNQVE